MTASWLNIINQNTHSREVKGQPLFLPGWKAEMCIHWDGLGAQAVKEFMGPNSVFLNSVLSHNRATPGGCHLCAPWALASAFLACFEVSALPFSLYLCLTPYVWLVSVLGRHTLSVVLSCADSLVLVLTDSVSMKTAAWVLQARYIIRLQRC